MPKYKEIREKRGLQARQVAEAAGVDVTMLSRFENYRALPIPEDFRKILAALGCFAADVYSPNEVLLLPETNSVRTTGGARVQSEPDEYKMTVRLSNECREVLTKEVLHKCGYKNIGAWITECIYRLKDEYDDVVKTEKSPASRRKDHGAVGTRHTIVKP